LKPGSAPDYLEVIYACGSLNNPQLFSVNIS
jgi:hypothetical protein